MRQLFRNLVSILIRWPIFPLLLLQISLSLFLEYQSKLFGALLILVTCLLFFIHLKERVLKRFFVFLFIVALSGVWFWHELKPLSANIFPKKAHYVATLTGSTFKTDRYSKIIIDLKERLSPIPDAVSGRVLLTIGTDCNLYKGSDIEFLAKVKPPTTYHNPGVFDYQRYLNRKNIWGKAFVKSCDEIVIKKFAGPGVIDQIQHRIFAHLKDLHSKNSRIMSSLLMGTKTMSRDQKDQVRDAGLSHLFAISGTHFGVMSALVFLLVSLVLGIVPKIYLKVPRQKIAAAVTAVFVIFYMTIVAPQPSVFRAGSMIILFLLAIIWERQKNILYIVLLSASVILFFRPLELFTASFQLSYLCVLILAIIYPHVLKFFQENEKIKNLPRPVNYMIQILLISWLINLMLLPLVLLEFGTSPLNGFINNLWAVPYFQFTVIPLALMYLLSAVFFPFASSVILSAWNQSITGFLYGVDFVQSLNFPEIDFFTPHVIHVLIFYAAIFLFFLTRNKKVLLTLMILLMVSLGGTYYENKLSYDLRIRQLDVGQGDAVLVQTRGKNILIDTGGHLYFDMGTRVLLPYFRHIWLNRLDVVVLTHSDLDHYGSLSSLLEELEILAVWINDRESDDMRYQQLISKIKKRNIPVKIIAGEKSILLDDQTTVQILAPTKEFSHLIDDNNHSVVIKVSHGDYDALFAGDLSKQGEKILVGKYGDQLQAEYLKVSHHGSNSSSTPAFLDVVRPKLATIGVAKDSRFGHPHRKVLARLKERDVSVLRTDLHGAVGVVLRDGLVEVWKYNRNK